MTVYLIGCVIAFLLTMILDTIEFRSGVRKLKYEHAVIIGLFTILSWLGVVVASIGLVIYIYDTYKEIITDGN